MEPSITPIPFTAMIRRHLSLLIGALFLALSCPAILMGQEDEPTPPKKTKKATDDAELPTIPAVLKDKEFVLPAKLNTKAKIYFIYKSRSACGICVHEAPEISAIYKSMKGKKAELVMLNIDVDKETAAKWAKEVKMKFPIVAPNEHRDVPFPYTMSDDHRLLPYMVAVDANGNKIDQANGDKVAAFLKDWKKILRDYEKREKKEAAASKRSSKHSPTTSADEEE